MKLSAAASGSMPNCTPRSRITGANTGTVRKIMEIQSMKVPKTVKTAMKVKMISIGGQSRFAKSDRRY